MIFPSSGEAFSRRRAFHNCGSFSAAARTALVVRLSTLGLRLLVCFAASTQLGATTWYVDCNATNGANNGTNWANAYTSMNCLGGTGSGCSCIGTNVSPGDTVEISGGIYPEYTD